MQFQQQLQTPMTSSNGVQYLTPQALAERWCGVVTLATLSNWRSAGRGPRFLKAGGRVLYPLQEVERFEQRNMRGIPNNPKGQ